MRTRCSGRKTKRSRRPTSSKTNGGLIRSVIAIIHNYSAYSLNCTHRRSHANIILNWLAHFMLCSFLSPSLFLCFASIFILSLRILKFPHSCMVIVSNAMHFIIMIIHVPPHAFISTWAPILTGTANGFFIKIKREKHIFCYRSGLIIANLLADVLAHRVIKRRMENKPWFEVKITVSRSTTDQIKSDPIRSDLILSNGVYAFN